MAKRLSKDRRAKALNRMLVIARAKANDDAPKLQQGAVKCALNRTVTYKGLLKPHERSWEGSGSKTRTVPKRWSQK